MNKLWYTKPSGKYGIPLGNGISAVMVYSKRKGERLAFNNCTLWSGYPEQQLNSQDYQVLQKVRELIFAGKNKEADILSEKELSHSYSAAYLPLGEATLEFFPLSTSRIVRSLDIAQSIYKAEDSTTQREAFASYPDNVIVYRIQSTRPINIKIKLSGKLKSKYSYDGSLNLTGNAPDYCAPNYKKEKEPIQYDKGKGMGYCLRIETDTNGQTALLNNGIIVKEATTLTLYAATATGFLGYQTLPNSNPNFAKEQCKAILASIKKDYPTLKDRHITDYKKLYNAQSLTLNDSFAGTTDKLVKECQKGNFRPAFAELAYNFAKYLIVSGSRVGGQALNLQGIWNEAARPPWSSNYTVNINTQMNYWPTTAMGLAECALPFLDMVYELACSGKASAKVLYNCGGFACNHNTDLWRKTTPAIGAPMYMFAPLCGVWLANEAYFHYKNASFPPEYQAKIKAAVETAAEFCNDFLVEYNGQYVICPSVSPENRFRKDKQSCSLDYATAYDMGLVRQVFANYLELLPKGVLAKDIKDKLSKLYPFRFCENGLLEWSKEYQEAEAGHRHFSPLYAFFPANIINYYNDPLAIQVQKLFDNRIAHTKSHIGWSGSWAACIAAKLRRAEQVKELLAQTAASCFFPNLLGVHQPRIFQIDGNFGFAAAVNQAIATCEEGIFELLPACPWKSGQVKDLRIAGARLSFTWQGGKVTKAVANKKIKMRSKNLAQNCILSEGITIVS